MTSLALYSDPVSIQQRQIKRIESDLLNPDEAIVDTNNTLVYLLDLFAVNTGDIVRSILNQLEGLHESRAQTAEDLIKFLSDNDFNSLNATPSMTYLNWFLDSEYLRQTAVDVNDNYSKVVIPRNTVFNVGAYTFGIYYPVELKINKHTGTFLASFDANTSNPLHLLSQNTLDHQLINTAEGERVVVKLPIHQFTRTSEVSDIVSDSGFYQQYVYTDKFYAVQVFYQEVDADGNFIEDSWIAMHLTQNEKFIDPQSPTAKFRFDPSLLRLEVEIPQVYFTTNQVSNRIKVDYYTTKGELDIDISNYDAGSLSFSLVTETEEEATYSNILQHITTEQLAPTTERISGGSNGYTLDQIRELILNNSVYGSLPIDPLELSQYFKKQGFQVVYRYLDGVTNRIYYVMKPITSGSNLLASGNLNTVLTETNLVTRTIRSLGDGSYMITPLTLFKYQNDNEGCVPLSNSELDLLDSYSANKAKLIEVYNNNTYTVSPFTVRVDTRDQASTATSYNLLTPSISKMEFEEANASISTQASVRGSGISYSQRLIDDSEGSGGPIGKYSLYLYLNVTNDIAGAILNDLVVYVGLKSVTGEVFWKTATLIETGESVPVCQVDLETDFAIDSNGYLRLIGLTSESGDTSGWFELSTALNVVTLLPEEYFTSFDNTPITSTVAPIYQSGYVPLVQQTIEVIFGNYVSAILNDLTIVYEGEEYERYTETEYYQHTADEYQRDVNGIPVYQMVTDESGTHPVFTLLNRTNEYRMDTTATYEVGIKTPVVADYLTWLETYSNSATVSTADLTAATKTVAGKYNLAVYSNAGVLTSLPITMGTTESTIDLTDVVGLSDGDKVYLLYSRYSGTDLTRVVQLVDPDLSKFEAESVTDSTLQSLVLKSSTYPINVLSADLIGHIPRGAYSATRTYSVNDMVYYDGNYYVALTETLGIHPIGNPGTWGLRLLPTDPAHNDPSVYFVCVMLLTTYNVGDTVPETSAITAAILGKRTIKHQANYVVLDGNQEPIVKAERTRYSIVKLVHLNAKMLLSTEPEHADYLNTVVTTMKSYFDLLVADRNELYQMEHLFFAPIKSIGNTMFYTAGQTMVSKPLELSIGFRLYVEQHIIDSVDEQTSIRNSILSIVDSHLVNGAIACTAVATDIASQLSDQVSKIDVLGINGEIEVQTLTCVNQGDQPCIRQMLYLKEDGTIGVTSDLTLEFVLE